VLVPLRFEGRTFPRQVAELEISKNMVVIMLYVITIFLSTVIVSHLYITTFGLNEVVFEEVSAISNVGLGVGYITAASPLSIKWVFIILMWLGRLEIVPVIILVTGVFKGIQDDLTQQKPAPPVYDHKRGY
jgi:trk system potassium uptake protein TrkH